MKVKWIKIMKMNKFLFLIVFTSLSFAQQKTTAKLNSVTENGLHKIILPSQIRSFSKEDLSDFRIFDSKQIEVPYFIVEGNQTQFSSSFEEYTIVSKNVVPQKSTSIVVESPNKTINEITLSIANIDVTKQYSISGSSGMNDKSEWFGLVNNAELFDLNDDKSTNVFKTITFPLSSYRYLKIDFNDKKTLPVNVLKIGDFKNKIETGSLQEIVSKKTEIIPNKKKTLAHITFDNPEIINQIQFSVSSPSFYKRNTRIYLNKSRKIKRHTETYQEDIAQFELNSETKNIFTIPQAFEKELFIEIENEDNPALVLSSIQFFQIPVAIIADLKANEKYTIATGNENLMAPQYDISYFKNKVSNSLPETTVTAIKHENANLENVATSKAFYQQPWFLWFCIAIGGIAILYFTTSLIRDMKNN